MKLESRQDFARLINERGYKVGLEVGVRTALYSKYILLNSNLEKMYGIDPYTPNIQLFPSTGDCEDMYKKALAHMQEFGDRYELIRGYSPEAANLFKDDFFDFIYIDGLHDGMSVNYDVRAWWPKLKTGGIIAGHDYMINLYPGLVESVNKFAEEKGQLVLVTGSGTDWYGESDHRMDSWWITKV